MFAYCDRGLEIGVITGTRVVARTTPGRVFPVEPSSPSRLKVAVTALCLPSALEIR